MCVKTVTFKTDNSYHSADWLPITIPKDCYRSLTIFRKLCRFAFPNTFPGSRPNNLVARTTRHNFIPQLISLRSRLIWVSASRNACMCSIFSRAVTAYPVCVKSGYNCGRFCLMASTSKVCGMKVFQLAMFSRMRIHSPSNTYIPYRLILISFIEQVESSYSDI